MSEFPLSVVFRADASIDIGWGHVMRCVTLAKAIVANGGRCLFLSRAVAGNLIEWVRAQGFEVLTLASQSELTDAAECRAKLVGSRIDWLIVDSYQLGESWELSMRGVAQRLMVIDDYSNRFHEADLLLNQNLDVSRDDYHGRTPARCRLCTGPEYALLRPEFAESRGGAIPFYEARQKRLLLSMGGTDAGDSTSWVLEAIDRLPLPPDWEITVVMGGAAPALEKVKKRCSTMSVKTDVFIDVSNMAQLMATSSLGIGAAGSTSWERCCMGLPSVLVALADNQKPIAEALERRGAAAVVALDDTLCLQAALQLLVSDDILRDTMSSRAAAICDGAGLMRVLSQLSWTTTDET